jgi:phage shock protein A
MGVFRRVSDIISANLNDLVERFESPEAMLRQAIREMDAAVSRTMEGAARVIADGRLLESQISACRQESAECERRAREALRSGDDEAARRALARRHDRETLIAALGDQFARSSKTAAKLRRRLDAMRVRRADAERQLQALVARQRATVVQRSLLARPSGHLSDEAGFSRFERTFRRIERDEAEADVLLELSSGESLSDGSSAADREIERQLQALKEECRS